MMLRRQVLKELALFGLVALVATAFPATSSAQALAPGRVYLPLVLKSPSSGGQLRYVAAADAYIFEAGPDVNRGTDFYLMAGFDGRGDTMEGRLRSLLWFDLPNDNGTRASKALLRVYYAGFDDLVDEQRPITVHVAVGEWNERTVTWADQPVLGEAFGSVSIIANDQWGYRDIDVTALVQQWLAGTLANDGLFLIGPEAGGSDWSYRAFLSRESAMTNKPYPPELIIELQ